MSSTNQSRDSSFESESFPEIVCGITSRASDIPDCYLPDYVDHHESVHASFKTSDKKTHSLAHGIRELSSLVRHRVGDTPFTRSDLLNMHHTDFEYHFAPVWANRQRHYFKSPKCDGSKSSTTNIPQYDNSQQLFNPKNYSAMVVPRKPDHGIDLIEWHTPDTEQDYQEKYPNMKRPPREYTFFQIKQYDDTKVSAPEVQAFVGSCLEYQHMLTHPRYEGDSLRKAFLVTTSELTEPAAGAIRRISYSPINFTVTQIEYETVVRLFRRYHPNSSMSVDEIKNRYIVDFDESFPSNFPK